MEDTDLLEVTSDGKEEKRIRVLTAVTKGFEIRPVGSDIAKVCLERRLSVMFRGINRRSYTCIQFREKWCCARGM